MTEHADLIAACAAAPDDDEPRLVWADAVGGERGEFVVVQCKLARGGLAPAESGWLRRRQRELLRAHGREWAQLGGIASRARFRRGFVEAIEVDAAAVDHPELFDRAPLLRSITATGMHTTASQPVALERMQTLLASRTLQRVHGLFIRPAPRDDDDVVFEGFAREALEEAPRALKHLRAFGSRDTIGFAVLRQLQLLGKVERLWLRELSLARDVVAVLDEQILVDLELELDVLNVQEIVPRLPHTLRSLRVHSSSAWNDVLKRLAASPCALSLERLAIAGCRIDDAAPLAELRRLRSLDLGATMLVNAPRVVEQLVATTPALRELRPFDGLTPKTLRPIVERLGPQLELLDLRGCGELRTVGDAIDATVAGDVRYGMRLDDDPLLLADDDVAAPWWEATTVRL